MEPAETTGTEVAPMPPALEKWATGIVGFDEISHGGLPQARLAVISGPAGSGKTVFALHALVNKARGGDKTSVFISFEESIARVLENASAFHWDFHQLAGGLITFVDGRVPSDSIVVGDFDLGGLLAAVGVICDETNASCVVFDGLDSLLSELPDAEAERGELLRIDQWCLERDVACLITAKTVDASVRDQQRRNVLDYMTDCVIELRTEMFQASAARTLRIAKYRGSGFAANAFPVVITEDGFQIIAGNATRLSYPSGGERLSTGVPRLDAILEGGIRRSTATLISGASGTSKTVLSGYFARAACQRGEKVLFISFDESVEQIIDNLKSIDVDLAVHVAAGRLLLISQRSWTRSPEEYLVNIRRLIAEYAPRHIVIDPFSALEKTDHPFSNIVCEILIDDVRAAGITLYMTSLIEKITYSDELTVSNVSTIADTWIHLTYRVRGGERNRALTVVKSRGTNHSNQVRELIITPSGLDLVDPYTAEGEVLMGSARAEKEERDARKLLEEQQDLRRRELAMKRQAAVLETQLEAMLEERRWRDQELEALRLESAERQAALQHASVTRRARREGSDPPAHNGKGR